MSVNFAGATRHLGCIIIVGTILTSCAYAGDFYWQGRRNAYWIHGLVGDVSNWYDKPPLQGQALHLPAGGDTAIFAQGARIYNLQLFQFIHTVGKILFLQNSPRYSFTLSRGAKLWINKAGIFNRSTTEPRYVIRRDGGMALYEGARLFSFTAARPALFYLESNSFLKFFGESRGGTAWAGNTGGSVSFHNRTSAERMTIVNYNTIQAPFSRIDFHHRSTGGNARFINQFNSILNFTQTLGPDGNGRMTAGSIQNFGKLYVGTRILGVTDFFTQRVNGVSGDLYVSIFREEAGAIIVTKRAVLGGALVVDVREPVPGRGYGVVFANGGRVGTFSEVRTTNVTMPQPHVSYTPNGVILYF